LPDPEVDPCSSKSCYGDISAALTPNIETEESIKVKLCTHPDTTKLAAIWEINFSSSNESNKLEGFFEVQARDRLRSLQSIPEFDTQLSFVSIVGGRGVGKSTVASLLSGNSSMFEVTIHFKINLR
jgi:ABC-type transport system involved in cytochrome bd biosynthesis fused ATPase/permease subunit